MAKHTTGQSLRLSIQMLKKYLDGSIMLDSRRLSWGINGKICSTIGYKVNSAIPPYYVELDYTWNGKPIKYKIELVTTTPHYGGKRWWFICPLTKKRCSVLYSAPGQEYFGSRTAFNLSYDSQNENYLDRKVRKYRKYLEKHGIESAWSPKPKGMHWKTYNKVINTAADFEDYADSLLRL